MTAVGWTQGKVKATGRPFRIPVAHLWTIDEGRVSSVRFSIDNPEMHRALAVRGP